jgi:exosortase F-associated protein
MIKKLLHNWFQISLIGILVLGLIAVRGFEKSLFYDPFLEFFKGDFNSKELPNIDYLKLLASCFFRFLLNSGISIAIIYLLFKDLSLVKFASILYSVLFVVLIVILLIIVDQKNSDLNIVLFYVRRFLLQPILLLLFVPAFYYQKQQQNFNN